MPKRWKKFRAAPDSGKNLNRRIESVKYLTGNLKLFLLLAAAVFVVKAQADVKDSTAAAETDVFLNVSVWSEKELLKDLRAPDFEIYEGKKRQEITFFKRADEPSSIGVLFDLSASMRSAGAGKANKIALAARGFNFLLANGHPENDYFFISSGKTTSVLLEPTQDKNKVGEVLNNLAAYRAVSGAANFHDAVNSGFEKVSRARQQKKVLILITNGADNNYFAEAKKLFRGGDVLLYAINILPDTEFYSLSRPRDGSINSIAGTIPPLAARNLRSFFSDSDSRGLYSPFFSAADNLEILASETGGRAFYPINAQETGKAFEMLAAELRSQYLLGFKPVAWAKRNEWRKIEVKVNLPKEKKRETGKIFVRSRTGFYF